MAERLDRPVTLLAEFTGPVRIGRFDNGTLLIAGPSDKPILIKNGTVMHLAESDANGDLHFSYFDDAERASWAKSSSSGE